MRVILKTRESIVCKSIIVVGKEFRLCDIGPHPKRILDPEEIASIHEK